MNVPQPEELPSEVSLLTLEDQNKYLGQLEPFLSLHGFKPATWGDWLEINALEVEECLLDMWESDVFFKNPGTLACECLSPEQTNAL